MIVVVGGGLIPESFLEPDLDIEELTGRLSPSMIVLEEHIVKMHILLILAIKLVHMWWNVALIDDVARPDLRNVHVDEKAVVGVDLVQFVLGQVSRVDVVLDVAVLMWQYHIGMPMLISWSFEIVESDIFISLVCIVFEEKAAVCGYFFVHGALEGCELFRFDLLCKVELADFLLNQFADFTLDHVDFRVLVRIMSCQCREELLPGIFVTENFKIVGLLGIVLGIALGNHLVDLRHTHMWNKSSFPGTQD